MLVLMTWALGKCGLKPALWLQSRSLHWVSLSLTIPMSEGSYFRAFLLLMSSSVSELQGNPEQREADRKTSYFLFSIFHTCHPVWVECGADWGASVPSSVEWGKVQFIRDFRDPAQCSNSAKSWWSWAGPLGPLPKSLIPRMKKFWVLPPYSAHTFN
jgi:hypothetical protein